MIYFNARGHTNNINLSPNIDVSKKIKEKRHTASGMAIVRCRGIPSSNNIKYKKKYASAEDLVEKTTHLEPSPSVYVGAS